MAPTPHSIYSRDCKVLICHGKDKWQTFAEVVHQSGFLEHIEAHWLQSGKAKADFLVAIKPSIMTAMSAQPDSPAYTDPELVEGLIAALTDEGFSRFAVVESQNVASYGYEKRTVENVARMCGYTGSGYRIADLTLDHVEYDYGGVLGRHPVGRVWKEADYRVSFAKNKTHLQAYYTACMKNVYGCLPEWDKKKFYHRRGIEFWDATMLVLEHWPVHFGFVDAWISGDGLTGCARDATPRRTHAFMASDNIFGLDWVAGEKMGIYPPRNPIIAAALQKWTRPKIHHVGPMDLWEAWGNVPPAVVWAVDKLETSYGLSKFASRVGAAHMDPRFPPKRAWQWLFGPLQWLAHKAQPMERLLVTPIGRPSRRRLPSPPAPVPAPAPREPQSDSERLG